jgi:hypothetical protein
VVLMGDMAPASAMVSSHRLASAGSWIGRVTYCWRRFSNDRAIGLAVYRFDVAVEED